MKPIEDFSKEELRTLVEIHAKNWLAHDGCWFLAAEEEYGLEKAIELDIKSWRRFAVAEAKRIMRAFDIPEGGGLRALEKALQYRLYATINRQEIVWEGERAMIFRMVECRVQQTRAAKNLPAFPCKPVGVEEFSQFAGAIDPRIKTECVSCPPDVLQQGYCTWRFTLA